MNQRRRHIGLPALLGGLAGLTACSHSSQPPTEAAAVQIVRALDDAFQRGSMSDFRALFVPSAHGSELALTAPMLGHGGRLTQSSRLIGFEALGPVGVARLETTQGIDGRTGAEHVTVRQSYLAFRDDGDGPRIVFFEQIDPGAGMHTGDKFTGVYQCPACNFQIGADALMDWLVVPSPSRISGCVEMVSFYRVGEDIQLTLSIHRNDRHEPARDLLQRLVETPPPPDIPLDEGRRVAEVVDLQGWQPPHYAARTPEGMMGARCDVVLRNGEKQSLHLITHQGTEEATNEICYLLTVKGSAAARMAFMADIDTWLASFHLIDSSKPPATIGELSALAHSGGALAPDGSYRNDKYGLEFRGPADWKRSPMADCGLFGVTYVCPTGTGVIHVMAYAQQPGSVEQRQGRAYQQVRDRLAKNGHRIVDDSQWFEPPPTTMALAARELQSEQPDSSGRRRLDRILLFSNILVIVDGLVGTDDAAEAFHSLADSVRQD